MTTECTAVVQRRLKQHKSTRVYLLVASCSDLSNYIIDDISSFELTSNAVIGRSEECDFVACLETISRRHCIFTLEGGCWHIRDLGSTNGTFVNGEMISEKTSLHCGAVIRIGGLVLVFHIEPGALHRHSHPSGGGVHHSLSAERNLHRAAVSGRHILITGESGVGKEIAAQYLIRDIGPCKSFVMSAADYGTEDEGLASLFGVAAKVFTSVDGRHGALKEADGGALFIDEAHRYPERIQAALLRLLETGVYRRVGEVEPRKLTGRIILASNAHGSHNGLIRDLYNRLHHVHIPSLRMRKADVPSIFQNLIWNARVSREVSPMEVLPCIGPDESEALCLTDWSGVNVRGLIHLSDEILADITMGIPPFEAVDGAFADLPAMTRILERQNPQQDMFSRPTRDVPIPPGKGKFETNKDLILCIYRESGGNISETCRRLASAGLPVSARWLSIHLKQWGQ